MSSTQLSDGTPSAPWFNGTMVIGWKNTSPVSSTSVLPSTNFKRLNWKFKTWAVTQIRLFLFAGHDSTSSTICYCYYLFSKRPAALARIRAEHDVVFGPDLSKVPNLLAEQAHLINQLTYTVAVIKEALRLFLAASAMRSGLPGVELQESNCSRYPSAGMNIWILNSVLQRHPEYWKEPDAFIRDRWLVGPWRFLISGQGRVAAVWIRPPQLRWPDAWYALLPSETSAIWSSLRHSFRYAHCPDGQIFSASAECYIHPTTT